MNPQFSMKSLKDGASRHELKQYFLHSFQIYEQLFSFVKNQRSFYCKPEPLRHPLIFYYGHTAVFYINKLYEKGLIKQRVDPKIQSIMAVGVDQMDWDDLDETHYNWPSFDEVTFYRAKVKDLVLGVIQKIETKINWDSDAWIILMGIEHQKIHLQTSSVIIRRLPIDEINPSTFFIDCPQKCMNPEEVSQNSFKIVRACKFNWPRNSKEQANYYGWDNQFGSKVVQVPQFRASRMLVSNGEYLCFVRENGYQKEQFWDAEGQAWLNSAKPKHPLFWISNPNGGFFLKTMNQIINLPLDWPVQVNNLEATAFCNWKSKKQNKKIRLPTEDEYFALRQLLQQDHFSWKNGEIGNINMEKWFSPCPVNYFQNNGFYDIIGNVWQHCSTPIYPFENFQIHPIYEDFTTPTFDGRHFTIKGGSFVSCGNESFKHSRYAFRRHFYQFAGFRYVEADTEPFIPHTLKDQCDEKVLEFLNLHFVKPDSYAVKVKKIIQNHCIFEKQKFIHIGCSVGMVVLQMSKHFSKSYGTDFSARFFQMATRILEKGELTYKNLKINKDQINPKTQNIMLYQMNPENLDQNKINGFKVALVDGLVIRKQSIQKCLKKLYPLMIQQSFIIIVNTKKHKIISQETFLQLDKTSKLVMQTKTDIGNELEQDAIISLYSIKN